MALQDQTSSVVLRSVPSIASLTDTDNGARVALRYLPRAGLLPELSQQTYDAFYKALREAILNGLDAGATRVTVDCSDVSSGTLIVEDDGRGMTLDALQNDFLSLGGSDKFDREDQFGRIGIGSLALLQYATATVIETKVAGTGHVTIARLNRAVDLGHDGRRSALSDFHAGFADDRPYSGSRADHFTRVRLCGLTTEALSDCIEVGAFYRLVERLRRVLPLPWADGPLKTALRVSDHDVISAIERHTQAFSGEIRVRSNWGDEFALTRRAYGDDGVPGEEWIAPPTPFLHAAAVKADGRRRKIVLAGYLLSQARATPAWSGVCARVQNVAVEEQTWFDLHTDPGFRKYITGELFVFGDVDSNRLINIDRASFNHESADYQAIRRFMQVLITKFKAECVQRPQRRKVEVRRCVERHIALTSAMENAAAAATALAKSAGITRLPSSNNGRLRSNVERSLEHELRRLGVEVTCSPKGAQYYNLAFNSNGQLHAQVSGDLLAPVVTLLGLTYRMRLVDAQPTDAPLLVRNRPREIVVNTGHPAVADGRLDLVASLELAYLLGGHNDSNALYDNLLYLVARPPVGSAAEVQTVGSAVASKPPSAE